MSKEKKIWIKIFVALAVGILATVSFVYGFSVWNVPLYVIGIAALFLSVSCMIWALTEAFEFKKVWLTPILGAVYTALLIGFSALLHVVILKQTFLSVTASVVTLLNVIFYTVLFVLIQKKLKTPFLPKQLIGFLLIAFIVAGNMAGLIPYALGGRYHDYYAALQEAKKRSDGVVLPQITTVRQQPNASLSPKLIVNIDPTTQIPDYDEYLMTKKEITTKDLQYYIEPYLNTGVTDLVFCISGQTSISPTEVMTYVGDKLKQTMEDGKSVDYSSWKYWWRSLEKDNINPIPAWIDGSRENGIRPWISLRMNDCHDSSEETSALRGEMFYTARDNGWMIGEEYGYYHTCFNYKVPQIREYMLSYIQEQLNMYDVDVLELDWLREIYCFDYLNEDNAEIVAIMNGFMKEVKDLVIDAENRYDHPIELSVRLMRDIDQCKVFGFDVRSWVRDGLVDSITVTPRFSSCDSGMDIAWWKKEFPSVEIYAGLETIVAPDGVHHEDVVASADVACGYAAEYLCEGANGIYLFNYMAYSPLPRNHDIYMTCASIAALLKHNRRHIMTYQDIAPEGYERYKPLPIAALKNKPALLVQKTGFVPEGATVNVYLGFTSTVNEKKVSVTYNGRKCTFEGQTIRYGDSESNGEPPVANGYVPEGSKVYQFSLTDTSAIQNAAGIVINAEKNSPLIVTYLEIEILPQAK